MAGFTQEDLDNLRAAMKSGANKIKHGDKDVGFRSVEEFKELERMMLEDIAKANQRPRVLSAVATTSRS